MHFLDLSIIDSIVVDNISSFLIISHMQIKGYKLIVKHTGECNFLLKQQYRYVSILSMVVTKRVLNYWIVR